MNMQDFFISNSAKHRISRHTAFLAITGLTFFFQSIVPGKSIYETAFYSFCCFFPACILSVYVCLYLLLPFFLHKKKYLLFFAGFLLLAATCYFINYHATGLFFRLATGFGKPGGSVAGQMNLGLVNTSHAVIIGGLALGIKFAKHIYLQQKENSMLARKKINTDLRLEKTRIYPRLLYQSLDHMRSGIVAGSNDASLQLLKVSELLSYILYDNDEKLVPLDKEITMVQHMIDIGRTGRSADIETKVTVSGDPSHKYIIPMTLFPLLENCFKLMGSRHQAPSGLQLDVSIRTNDLRVQLTLFDTVVAGTTARQQFLEATRMRLDPLYPCAYHLQTDQDGHDTVVVLFVEIKNKSTALLLTGQNENIYETE